MELDGEPQTVTQRLGLTADDGAQHEEALVQSHDAGA